MGYPAVSLLLPVLNEEAFLDRCLESLQNQDYPGRIQIVAIDGGSDDRTLEMLEGWQSSLPDLVVAHNPRRFQSYGLNQAAIEAIGDILIRADAHSTYSPDYVRRSVERLAELGESAAVGGPMRPEGTTAFGRAVSQALTSKFGVGPGAHHHESMFGEVDTVYLGAFSKRKMLEIGGFRSFPHPAAEDTDFYARWRRAGGRVILDPEVRSVYRPRQTPRSLWRQWWRNGGAKADMVLVDRRWPSVRSSVPTFFVVALAGSVVAGLVWSWWPAIALIVAWVGVLGLAARGSGGLADRLRTMAAAGIIQLSYGLGLTLNLFRRPSSVRKQTDHGVKGG